MPEESGPKAAETLAGSNPADVVPVPLSGGCISRDFPLRLEPDPPQPARERTIEYVGLSALFCHELANY